MFGVLWPFSSRSCIVVFQERCDRKNMTSFSPISCFCQRISVFFLCIPSWENRRMAPVLWLSCFLKHLLRLEKHHLSDAPCSGPQLEFFLMTKPVTEVMSQLAFWVVVGLRLYFKFSRNFNKWYRFLKKHCNQDIDVWQNSRKVRRSLFGSCRREMFVIPRWTCWSLLLTHVFKELFLMLMFLEHLDQLCGVILVAVHPAVSPLRSIHLVSGSQQCCFGFPRGSPHRVAIPKMILLLDLVNHFAN